MLFIIKLHFYHPKQQLLLPLNYKKILKISKLQGDQEKPIPLQQYHLYKFIKITIMHVPNVLLFLLFVFHKQSHLFQHFSFILPRHAYLVILNPLVINLHDIKQVKNEEKIYDVASPGLGARVTF